MVAVDEWEGVVLLNGHWVADLVLLDQLVEVVCLPLSQQQGAAIAGGKADSRSVDDGRTSDQRGMLDVVRQRIEFLAGQLGDEVLGNDPFPAQQTAQRVQHGVCPKGKEDLPRQDEHRHGPAHEPDQLVLKFAAG